MPPHPGVWRRRKEAYVIGSRSTAEDMTSFLFAEIAAAALEFHPTSSISPTRIDWLTTLSRWARYGRDRILPQKLDDWMRESVGEIYLKY
ncbi:hypothetical protein M5K25_006353 [Dendrobium thyrsiflorum]|uniref:Uncharacterized protein n=1 Tax=Dendrobium thyrsiflorum TaxID=117978 RepID=A0ABD0VCL3_DENTH